MDLAIRKFPFLRLETEKKDRAVLIFEYI